jgi:hypothetical protein
MATYNPSVCECSRIITDYKDIKNIDFKKSKIQYCSIGDEEFDKKNYKSILKRGYEIINDGAKIIKKSKINIKTLKEEYKGFNYLDKIGISFQGVNSNKCLLEIINQCIENKIELYMKIKLSDDSIINISF